MYNIYLCVQCIHLYIHLQITSNSNKISCPFLPYVLYCLAVQRLLVLKKLKYRYKSVANHVN